MKHVALLVLALVAGCSISGPDGPPPQLTGLPRALSDDEERVSAAANHFAFTLLKRLSEQQPNENVFVSPLSVSMSLGMAMNGATGTTLDQMRATLGFDQRQLSEINAGYRDLIALESGLDPTTTFDIANSVWHRNTFPFHQSYLDLLASNFGAEVKASPFDQSTVTQVNDWVKAQTNGRIPTILDGISQTDVMFLINAIYFKGSWRDGFDPSATFDGEFETIDGTTQAAKLMRRRKGEGKIKLAFVNGTQVGELSYGNGAFVMTVLVPMVQTNANQLTAALDTSAWRGFVEPLQEVEGEVLLPRFTLEYERELAEDLAALGMEVPFDTRADFSGMSPLGADLNIAFVKHKTFVRVDEVGTEAAAVTNTGIEVVSLPPGLRATQPFVFAIRERFSGTILFIGKIVRLPT